MRPMWYTLDADKNVVPLPEGTFPTDNDWEETRRVVKTILSDGKYVSTVFLGLDHSFTHVGAPVVFETMVFPSDKDFGELDCARYCFYDEAVKGHKKMVNRWKRKISGIKGS